MSATLLGSKWSTMADLSVANATIEALGISDVPGGTLNSTMGHWCHFAMDDSTHADWTEPFDWAVMGDFTVVVNATGVDVDDASNALDVGVQGSVSGADGTWVSLGAANAVIDGGAIEQAAAAGVYDYDTNGRMPYMRLVITAADASDSTILVAVIPH
jgi:hypothetical protein